MGCISTPMPNHLTTYQLHYFYYSSFDEWGRVGMEQMRRMDEMVRLSGLVG